MAKTLFGESNKNYVELSVEIMVETKLAYMVTDGDVEAWIPKSQLEGIEFGKDKEAEITIPEWLAQDKGLI